MLTVDSLHALQFGQQVYRFMLITLCYAMKIFKYFTTSYQTQTTKCLLLMKHVKPEILYSKQDTMYVIVQGMGKEA